MRTWKFLFIGILIVVFLILNIAIGSIAIPLEDTFRILFGDTTLSEVEKNIILRSRLPLL